MPALKHCQPPHIRSSPTAGSLPRPALFFNNGSFADASATKNNLTDTLIYVHLMCDVLSRVGVCFNVGQYIASPSACLPVRRSACPPVRVPIGPFVRISVGKCDLQFAQYTMAESSQRRRRPREIVKTPNMSGALSAGLSFGWRPEPLSLARKTVYKTQ